jgi:hypothetical protein
LVRENQGNLEVKRVLISTVQDPKHIKARADNIYKYYDNSNLIQKAQSR